jgi:hypothetical protein
MAELQFPWQSLINRPKCTAIPLGPRTPAMIIEGARFPNGLGRWHYVTEPRARVRGWTWRNATVTGTWEDAALDVEATMIADGWVPEDFQQ